MKYDTILFDADGTLLDFARAERLAVAEALAEIGVLADEKMIVEYSRINDGFWKMLERGEIEKGVLLYRRFEVFFEKYGIDGNAKEMAERYMYRLSEKGCTIDGALELCKRLSSKFRLYIVTNGINYSQTERIKRSGLLPFIEGFFVSEEVGYEKPSVKYFEYVEKHIPNFDKSRAVIVGDSLTSDIKGGIAFGIDTCWYNPKGYCVPAELSGKITYAVSDYSELYEKIVQGENL